jgi:hypothetical protein
MCASCGGKTGLSLNKYLLAATPVPLALAAGFLVPTGEDRLLLWILGVATMFVLYFRWSPLGKVPAIEPVANALMSNRRP